MTLDYSTMVLPIVLLEKLPANYPNHSIAKKKVTSSDSSNDPDQEPKDKSSSHSSLAKSKNKRKRRKRRFKSCENGQAKSVSDKLSKSNHNILSIKSISKKSIANKAIQKKASHLKPYVTKLVNNKLTHVNDHLSHLYKPIVLIERLPSTHKINSKLKEKSVCHPDPSSNKTNLTAKNTDETATSSKINTTQLNKSHLNKSKNGFINLKNCSIVISACQIDDKVKEKNVSKTVKESIVSGGTQEKTEQQRQSKEKEQNEIIVTQKKTKIDEKGKLKNEQQAVVYKEQLNKIDTTKVSGELDENSCKKPDGLQAAVEKEKLNKIDTTKVSGKLNENSCKKPNGLQAAVEKEKLNKIDTTKVSGKLDENSCKKSDGQQVSVEKGKLSKIDNTKVSGKLNENSCKKPDSQQATVEKEKLNKTAVDDGSKKLNENLKRTVKSDCPNHSKDKPEVEKEKSNRIVTEKSEKLNKDSRKKPDDQQATVGKEKLDKPVTEISSKKLNEISKGIATLNCQKKPKDGQQIVAEKEVLNVIIKEEIIENPNEDSSQLPGKQQVAVEKEKLNQTEEGCKKLNENLKRIAKPDCQKKSKDEQKAAVDRKQLNKTVTQVKSKEQNKTMKSIAKSDCQNKSKDKQPIAAEQGKLNIVIKEEKPENPNEDSYEMPDKQQIAIEKKKLNQSVAVEKSIKLNENLERIAKSDCRHKSKDDQKVAVEKEKSNKIVTGKKSEKPSENSLKKPVDQQVAIDKEKSDKTVAEERSKKLIEDLKRIAKSDSHKKSKEAAVEKEKLNEIVTEVKRTKPNENSDKKPDDQEKISPSSSECNVTDESRKNKSKNLNDTNEKVPAETTQEKESKTQEQQVLRKSIEDKIQVSHQQVIESSIEKNLDEEKTKKLQTKLQEQEKRQIQEEKLEKVEQQISQVVPEKKIQAEVEMQEKKSPIEARSVTIKRHEKLNADKKERLQLLKEEGKRRIEEKKLQKAAQKEQLQKLVEEGKRKRFEEAELKRKLKERKNELPKLEVKVQKEMFEREQEFLQKLENKRFELEENLKEAAHKKERQKLVKVAEKKQVDEAKLQKAPENEPTKTKHLEKGSQQKLEKQRIEGEGNLKKAAQKEEQQKIVKEAERKRIEVMELKKTVEHEQLNKDKSEEEQVQKVAKQQIEGEDNEEVQLKEKKRKRIEETEFEKAAEKERLERIQLEREKLEKERLEKEGEQFFAKLALQSRKVVTPHINGSARADISLPEPSSESTLPKPTEMVKKANAVIQSAINGSSSCLSKISNGNGTLASNKITDHSMSSADLDKIEDVINQRKIVSTEINSSTVVSTKSQVNENKINNHDEPIEKDMVSCNQVEVQTNNQSSIDSQIRLIDTAKITENRHQSSTRTEMLEKNKKEVPHSQNDSLTSKSSGNEPKPKRLVVRVYPNSLAADEEKLRQLQAELERTRLEKERLLKKAAEIERLRKIREEHRRIQEENQKKEKLEEERAQKFHEEIEKKRMEDERRASIKNKGNEVQEKLLHKLGENKRMEHEKREKALLSEEVRQNLKKVLMKENQKAAEAEDSRLQRIAEEERVKQIIENEKLKIIAEQEELRKIVENEKAKSSKEREESRKTVEETILNRISSTQEKERIAIQLRKILNDSDREGKMPGDIPEQTEGPSKARVNGNDGTEENSLPLEVIINTIKTEPIDEYQTTEKGSSSSSNVIQENGVVSNGGIACSNFAETIMPIKTESVDNQENECTNQSITSQEACEQMTNGSMSDACDDSIENTTRRNSLHSIPNGSDDEASEAEIDEGTGRHFIDTTNEDDNDDYNDTTNEDNDHDFIDTTNGDDDDHFIDTTNEDSSTPRSFGEILNVTTALAQMHNCIKCGQFFRSERSLRDHTRCCMVPPYLQCVFCYWKTNRKNTLRKHIKSKHKQECPPLRLEPLLVEIFKRSAPLRAIAERAALLDNALLHNAKSLTLKCNECFETFATKARLQKHIFKRHWRMPADIYEDRQDRFPRRRDDRAEIEYAEVDQKFIPEIVTSEDPLEEPMVEPDPVDETEDPLEEQTFDNNTEQESDDNELPTLTRSPRSTLVESTYGFVLPLETQNFVAQSVTTWCPTCDQMMTAMEKFIKCQRCDTPYIYGCKWCSQQKRNFQLMRIHVIRHHTERIHSCIHCGHSFSYIQDYRHHLRFCVKEKNISCPNAKCLFRTKYERSLKHHLMTCQKKDYKYKEKPSYSKPLPSLKPINEALKIQRKRPLSSGVLMENPIPRKKRQLDHISKFDDKKSCTENWTKDRSSSKYKYERTNAVRKYHCYKCSKTYKSNMLLSRHMSSCGKMIGSISLNCDHCSFKTVTKSTLVAHIHSKHAARLFRGIEAFSCANCRQVFRNYFIYRRHADKCKKVRF